MCIDGYTSVLQESCLLLGDKELTEPRAALNRLFANSHHSFSAEKQRIADFEWHSKNLQVDNQKFVWPMVIIKSGSV